MIKLKGCTNFRMRLVLATLSGKTVRIDDIRPMDDQPGITDCEASFLKLLAEVTNGSKVYINETGTTVKYTPGFIVGGVGLEFDCHTSRSIGYYLEPLIILSLFAKSPIEITLRGVVNSHFDISVRLLRFAGLIDSFCQPDVMRVVTLPLLRHFGVEEGIELKIKKRGAPPLGGGEVEFKCSNVKCLKSVSLIDRGRVKKVRGIAYTTKVNPMIATRVVSSARELLNNFIPDVWIFTDHSKGPTAGL
jgi:RNA 3'-terminal phosphate cyclase-like protein